jgi:hypothetical protein
MTPKEKAIELVDKYNNSIMSFLSDNMKYQNAIKCALIAVDEIIKTDILIDEEVFVMTPTYLAYWMEVKQELLNFKNK